MIRHFYHVWADGQWREPLDEHLRAVRHAGLPCHLTVGIVGSVDARLRVQESAHADEVVYADAGYEDVTLAALHRAATANQDSVFFYAHTKGAYHPNPLNTALRQSMTRLLVGDWADCRRYLDLDLAQAVGCHWLRPQDYPGIVEVPYFAGNFWWATGKYLAGLLPPASTSRYRAEAWLGEGNPEVKDLRPGWPTWGLFGSEVTQLLNPNMEVRSVD